MTISEVCRVLQMTPDTLRYYERVGLISKVRRTNGGFRDYSEEDCKWIGFIKCLRKAGIQIESLAEYVRLNERGEATVEERKQILIDERERLEEKVTEMQETLDRLNAKIRWYEETFITQA